MLDFTKKFDLERIGIATHAKRHPGRPALVIDDAIVTYKELEKDTNSLANSLLDLGIKPEDRISILFHNSPEILKAWSAAGKISVPVSLS